MSGFIIREILLEVQWPISVKAYLPPARWYPGWIFTEKAHFYKSLHLLTCFEPSAACSGAMTVKLNKREQISVQPKTNIKGRRRCCSCLLSSAWDDKHWEAFYLSAFLKLLLTQGWARTSLMLCKRRGVFQKPQDFFPQSSECPMGRGSFLTSHVISTDIWGLHSIVPVATYTKKAILMKNSFCCDCDCVISDILLMDMNENFPRVWISPVFL